MASSVTTISTTNALATTAEILLSGVIKLIAKDMTVNDEVYVFEETATEDDYQPVIDRNGNRVRLTERYPSVLLEGYGNYKFLLGPNTATGLVVGYVAA